MKGKKLLCTNRESKRLGVGGSSSCSRGCDEEQRGRGSEGETMEDTKTNPPGKRGVMEEMLQHPRQQRCVLLHQLCYYRHQYHLFLSVTHYSVLCSASVSRYGNGIA